ncbi:MAG: type II toxin-antitoxin system HipA family toxin [Deltaproteobacteria bacterium]|jgi:serine/threonine-protein kinase HipA|nr:type II toxin-antitoxin system HipA family toxin [Deltaproteobacteria bacterium]
MYDENNKIKENLSVYWDDEPVGRLHRPADSDGLFFKYDKRWLSGGKPAISRSMPLAGKTFSSKTTGRFFGNLMPEGQAMSDFAGMKKITEDNLFRFLLEYGVECAGALMIVDSDLPRPTQSSRYRDVTDIIINELSLPPEQQGNLIIITDSRLSLAGAQNKLPVLVRDGRYLVPEHGSAAATSAVIKTASLRYKNLQYNEAFCMDLAGKIGLPVAGSGIARLGGHDVFITGRYDRRTIGGEVTRYHQEDFCQAMGLPRSSKYQVDGGPGIKACMDILKDPACGIPETSRIDFAKTVIFNYIIGNCDAHAKNFSLLYDYHPRLNPAGSGVTLAPFYDLVSTRVYPYLSKDMAMSIGGTYRHGGISVGSWERLASDLSLGTGDFIDLALETAAAAGTRAEAVAESHAGQFPGMPLYGDLVGIVRSACEHIADACAKLKVMRGKANPPGARPRP